MTRVIETDQNVNIAISRSSKMEGSHHLLTIRQFCVAFPWPSESAMRSYVYRSDELGIDDAFIRVRRRVLVDPAKFFSLIKQVENRSIKGGLYEEEKR